MAAKRPTVGYSIWRGGQKRYIGITNDPERRLGEHHAAGNKGEMHIHSGPAL